MGTDGSSMPLSKKTMLEKHNGRRRSMPWRGERKEETMQRLFCKSCEEGGGGYVERRRENIRWRGKALLHTACAFYYLYFCPYSP